MKITTLLIAWLVLLAPLSSFAFEAMGGDCQCFTSLNIFYWCIGGSVVLGIVAAALSDYVENRYRKDSILLAALLGAITVIAVSKLDVLTCIASLLSYLGTIFAFSLGYDLIRRIWKRPDF